MPFIFYDKEKNTYEGSTRFMNINWKNKVLEIGSTWIWKQFYGTGLNKNMKFLKAQYAFETLGFIKLNLE